MTDLWVGGMYKPRRQVEKGEGVVEMYTILNNSFSVKLTKYKWGRVKITPNFVYVVCTRPFSQTIILEGIKLSFVFVNKVEFSGQYWVSCFEVVLRIYSKC